MRLRMGEVTSYIGVWPCSCTATELFDSTFRRALIVAFFLSDEAVRHTESSIYNEVNAHAYTRYC